jgi:hypothetical protein
MSSYYKSCGFGKPWELSRNSSADCKGVPQVVSLLMKRRTLSQQRSSTFHLLILVEKIVQSLRVNRVRKLYSPSSTGSKKAISLVRVSGRPKIAQRFIAWISGDWRLVREADGWKRQRIKPLSSAVRFTDSDPARRIPAVNCWANINRPLNAD